MKNEEGRMKNVIYFSGFKTSFILFDYYFAVTFHGFY